MERVLPFFVDISSVLLPGRMRGYSLPLYVKALCVGNTGDILALVLEAFVAVMCIAEETMSSSLAQVS